MRCRNFVRISMCFVLVAGWALVAAAAVKLPAVIGDNMVLQRGQPVPIWGWADKGEEVTVTVAGQTLTTKAGDDGRWKVVLAKLDVGQPLEMTVKGSSGNTITLKNILVGEVWVCSGQSNMEMGSRPCCEQREGRNRRRQLPADPPVHGRQKRNSGAAASRCADVRRGLAAQCTPESDGRRWGGFSALAYFFGRQLHKELGVPIGLIHSSGAARRPSLDQPQGTGGEPRAEAAGRQRRSVVTCTTA